MYIKKLIWIISNIEEISAEVWTYQLLFSNLASSRASLLVEAIHPFLFLLSIFLRNVSLFLLRYANLLSFSSAPLFCFVVRSANQSAERGQKRCSLVTVYLSRQRGAAFEQSEGV